MSSAWTDGKRPSILSQASTIFGGQLLCVIILFVTTPYIALGLGAEVYGLYTLLFLLLGYSVALDFGLGFALVKHVAEYDPDTHREDVDSFVNTATTVYCAIALLFAGTVVIWRNWIARELLHVPDHLFPVARDAVLLVAASSPFAAASAVFGSLLRGLLRFRYVALFSLANTSVYAIGSAILVNSGHSLRAIFAWYCLVTAMMALGQFGVLRRLLPGFFPRPRLDRQRLGQLFSFGSFIALNQLSRIALLQIDRLVIARLLSVAMAGYYAVPFGITQRLNMVGAAVATVAFPHSSASNARGGQSVYRSQYLQSSRVVAWLTLSPTLVLICFADLILRYWMSPAFSVEGSLPLRFLSVGVLCVSVASLDAVSIEGSGRPKITALFMGLSGLLNIIGLLVLTRVWGIAGASASVTFSLLVLSTLNVWYCSKNVTHTPIWSWLMSVVKPSLWTTLTSLPALLLLRVAVVNLPSMVTVCLFAMGLVATLGYWFFVPANERKSVKSRVVGFLSGKRTIDSKEEAHTSG